MTGPVSWVQTTCAPWQPPPLPLVDVVAPPLPPAAIVPPVPLPPAAVLLEDMGALGGIARRGIRHLREGLLARLLGPEREEVGRALAQAQVDVERLVTTHGKEALNARPDDAGGDPAAAT